MTVDPSSSSRGGMSRRELIRNAGIAGAAAWTAPIIIESVTSRALATTTSCVPCGSSAPGGIPGGGSGGFRGSPTCNIDSADSTRKWYVFKLQNSTCSAKGGNVLSGIASCTCDAGVAEHPVTTGACTASVGRVVTATASSRCRPDATLPCRKLFKGAEIHAGSDDCQPTINPCKVGANCQLTISQLLGSRHLVPPDDRVLQPLIDFSRIGLRNRTAGRVG